jgi:large subunit ribosomal protein L21
MYAIVDIAGQQFKVEKEQKLFVHRLEGEEGKKVSFNKVLLIDSGSKIAVGDPVVKGASVTAKILAHVKGDKVLVFKKKRRKGYKKLNGHRQYLSQIQIETISEKAGAKKEEAAKPASDKAETAKKPAVTKKPAAKAPAEKKPADTKSTAEKKSATKKPEAKSAAKTTSKPEAKASAKPAAKASAKPAAKTTTKKDTGEDKATTN